LSENLITFIVQGFFCHRVYRLSQKLPLTIICVILSILRFIGGIALSVESLLDVPKTPNGDFVYTFSWLITAALAVGAAADVVIAASLVYYLRKMTSPSNLMSTTAFLNRVMRWTLQTGLITSMTSVTVIICFQTMSNMVWFGLYVILAKLYSISLLVSLNTRCHSGMHDASEEFIKSSLEFQHPAPISISFQTARARDTALWSPGLPEKVRAEHGVWFHNLPNCKDEKNKSKKATTWFEFALVFPFHLFSLRHIFYLIPGVAADQALCPSLSFLIVK